MYLSKLISSFSVGFKVLDIVVGPKIPLILDRPFVKTTRMLVDIYKGLVKVTIKDREDILRY